MRALLVLAAIACLARADLTAEIDAIRQRYAEVTDRLDEEGRFFRTCVSVNPEDSIYPAVGRYLEELTFYWTNEGGQLWLHYATWTESHASRRDIGEVLYPAPGIGWEEGQGAAIYQHATSHDWDGNDTEYWWWWSEDGVLLWSTAITVAPDSTETESMPPDPGEVLYFWTPTRLLELFRAIHSDEQGT